MAYFPYRWTLRTTWANLAYVPRDVVSGIKNLIRWAPVVWGGSWFDSDYLLRLLEYKLRQMADKFPGGSTADCERHAREMRVCAELCRRMLADDYNRYCEDCERPHFHTYFPLGRNRSPMSGKRRDATYLGHLLGKHLPYWWD